jgi:hypothetical protein
MAAGTVDIGMGDRLASPGAHICALYSSSEERDAILRSYLRSALAAGDKCFCVLDPTDAAQMTRVVRSIDEDHDIDLSASLAARQLEVYGAEATTPFVATDKIEFWKDAVAGVISEGQYKQVRAIGEMSWFVVRDVPSAREVVRWESQLNELLPMYPQIHLCMFSLEKVGGAFLVDLVSTHQQVFVEGMLVENPYYLPPQEWLERQERGLGRLG